MRIERVVLENHGDIALFRRRVVDHAVADRDFAGGDVFPAPRSCAEASICRSPKGRPARQIRRRSIEILTPWIISDVPKALRTSRIPTDAISMPPLDRLRHVPAFWPSAAIVGHLIMQLKPRDTVRFPAAAGGHAPARRKSSISCCSASYMSPPTEVLQPTRRAASTTGETAGEVMTQPTNILGASRATSIG